MFKRLKQGFAILLVSALFVSSNGVVVAIHTCFNDFSKDVSLFTTSDCCEKENKCNKESQSTCSNISSTCCSFTYSYHKISAPCLFKKTPPISLLTTFIDPVWINVFQVSQRHFYSFFIVPDYLNKDPLLAVSLRI